MKSLSIFLLLFISSVQIRAQVPQLQSPDGGMYAYQKTKKVRCDSARFSAYYKLLFLRDSTKSKYTEAQTILQISDKYVRFADYYCILTDSINDFCAQSRKNAHNPEANKSFNAAAFKRRYYGVTLTILLTKQTTVQCRNLRKYEYAIPTPAINWILVQEDSVINNIVCKKATCSYAGRDYIAWYAESINLPYGPYLFYGLPGLVINLYDTKRNWIFINNGVGEAKELREMYLYGGKEIIKTTKEKALTAYRNEIEDHMNLAKEIIGLTVIGRKEQPIYLKRPSNMLELKW